MTNNRVYLFQGNYLIVPESSSDEDALGGTDREQVRRSFGDLDYYETPAIAAGLNGEGNPPIPAFLLESTTGLPPGWRTLSVRQAVVVLAGPKDAAFLPVLPGTGGFSGRLLRAYHILQWRKDSAYCGSCGKANGDSPSELARLCPRCGRIEYPRISPAIITLVINDAEEALLAHNVKFKNSVYSLIAGFNEAGESLEATVVREIKEEVNIDVTEIRYVTSQSWPFPNSLMVGFTARYAGGKLESDGVEIADARWFSRESVLAGTPELPAPGSVSRFIINRWLNGKNQ